MLEKDIRWKAKKYTDLVATLTCTNCGAEVRETMSKRTVLFLIIVLSAPGMILCLSMSIKIIVVLTAFFTNGISLS